MFRASLCPSQQCCWSWSVRREPDRPRPTALLPPRSYGKPEAAAAVDRLLMMGTRMPETCWAVSRQQTVNLYLIAASGWLIHLNAWRCTDLHTLNLSHTVCNETCQWKSIIRKVKWIRLNIYTIFWLPTGTFSLNSGNPVVYSGQVQSNQMKHATNPRQANTGRMHFQSRII